MTDPRVWVVSSYEGAVAAERMHSKRTVRAVALRMLVAAWVAGANAALALLKGILFERYRRASEIKHIVVYSVGTLGDNVLMLPAVAAIKRHFRSSRLTVVTNCDGFGAHAASFVFEGSPFVDRFIPLPDLPVQRHGCKIVIQFPQSEPPACDLFVDLSPFGNRGRIGAVVREMIFAKWLGARCAVGFKMSSYSRKHYLNEVQHYFVRNEARRPREVLRELSLTPAEGEDLLRRDAQAMERVQAVISGLRLTPPIIVLNPGAKLAASHWPAERFGRLAIWITDTYGATVVVNGTEAEKELCTRVADAADGKAVSLAGRLSIQELVELLRVSSACITNSTGPMTLAANIGLPTVVIASTRFSPTLYIPIGAKVMTIFCFSSNRYSYDDSGGASEDLLQIHEASVMDAIRQLLGDGPLVSAR